MLSVGSGCGSDVLTCAAGGASCMACSKQLGLEITDDEGCFNRINAVVSAAAEDKADTIRLGGSYGGSEIGDAALAVVLCGMHNNTSVTSLDLSMDGITDQGLEALAAHLRDNTCNNLLDISLDGNLFTSAGVASLSAALIHSAASVLMRLDLSSSSIGDEGASSIANVLASPSSPPLAALYLRECGIGNVGCKMLCAALKNNSVLHTLHLSGNSIADQSVADICETAVVSLSLLELNFANNDFSYDGLERLCKGLAESSSLVTVLLSWDGSRYTQLNLSETCAANRAHHAAMVEAGAYTHDAYPPNTDETAALRNEVALLKQQLRKQAGV